MLDPLQKVPATRTPIELGRLRAALVTGHQTIRAGEIPNRNRLRFAWAHVCLETGGGKSPWCFNLGNIKANATDAWQGAWCDISAALPPGSKEWPYQRAYASPEAAANDYWRLLWARYSRAIGEADKGDLHNAAVALKELGYYEADPTMYGDALARWGAHYDKRWPPEASSGGALRAGAALVAVAVLLVLATLQVRS